MAAELSAPWLAPEEWQAVRLSLKVAFWAVVAALPPGLIVAHALARWRFPGRGLLNVIVHLPLVLPPVVTGYILLVVFGRRGILGAWMADTLGLVLAFRWTGAAVAAAVMAFPLMVRAIRQGIESVDPGLEQAAATLGAGRVRVWLSVTLPLMAPGLIAGIVIGFAKALGEFGATMTFVAAIPGETRTISTAIHGLLQVPGQEGAVVHLALISVVLATGALALSEVVSRKLGPGR
jgi:molybdate transport system permease protein